MAQIGSYVPAKRMELSAHDAIYTRMGARDKLSHAMSTFLVELSEASHILSHATERSLMIFDEVSRRSKYRVSQPTLLEGVYLFVC